MYTTIAFVNIALFLVCQVNAIQFLAPRATDVATDNYDLIGFSPKPTTAPSPHDLRARVNRLLQPRAFTTNTCGYFNGDESNPYTCGIGSACVWNTASDYFGCCSVDGNGNFILSDCPGVANPYTSCYDYTDATDCIGACFTENRVWYVLQYCFTHLIFRTRLLTSCTAIQPYPTVVSPI